MSNEWRYAGQTDCEPLHYNWGGLDDVFLLSGYERIPTEDGEDIVIQELDALHRAIGMHLAQHKKALNGKEIRFLRHEMDLTQSQLGVLLAVTDQTVARWEKNETPITGSAEMLLRGYFISHVDKKVDLREMAEALISTDDSTTTRQVFQEKDGQWAAIAA